MSVSAWPRTYSSLPLKWCTEPSCRVWSCLMLEESRQWEALINSRHPVPGKAIILQHGLRLHPPLTLAKVTSKVQKEAAIIPILLRKLVCPGNTSHTPQLLSVEVNSTPNSDTQKIPSSVRSLAQSATPLQGKENCFARTHRRWAKKDQNEHGGRDLKTEPVPGGVSKSPHQGPDPRATVYKAAVIHLP